MTQELDIPVEHYFIDLRYSFLQMHLQKFLDENDGIIFADKRVPYFNKKYPKGFSKNLQTAQFFEQVMKMYGNNIEQMPFIKMIIDYHFIDAKQVIERYAFFYVVFVILPFIAQLLINDFRIAFWLNHLCLIGNLIFAFSKILVLRVNGLNFIFKDRQTRIDLYSIAIFVVYYYLRLKWQNNHVMPHTDADGSVHQTEN